MKKSKASLIMFASLFTITANGQMSNKYDLAQLLKENKLRVLNREITAENSDGKNAIVMSLDADEGLAWLKDVQFSTGTIELDIKGQNIQQHSFVGVAFHGLNDSTFEAIYFRPFQFLSTDPVKKARGVQYICWPTYTWQKLRAEFPGLYENVVEPAPDPDNWFHVKIVVKEKEAWVFVNDGNAPVLKVPLLASQKKGMIALYTADQSGGSFSNLVIQND